MHSLLFFQLVAVFAASFFDRLRGRAKHILGQRALDKLALGYTMAVVAGYPADLRITPAIMLCMAIGMSFGWGEPVGAAIENRPMSKYMLEWWQRSILKESVEAALTFRGFMWGFPVGLIGFIINDPVLVAFIPAYMISFPAAVYLGKLSKDPWGAQEYIRGALTALLVLAVYIGVN